MRSPIFVYLFGPMPFGLAYGRNKNFIMNKVVIRTFALSVGLAFVLSGCESLTSIIDNNPEPAGKIVKNGSAAANAQGTTNTDGTSVVVGSNKNGKYESAPDLTGAEELTAGGLVSDANSSQSTSNGSVKENVGLINNLEQAPQTNNTLVGAADPYSSVSEEQEVANAGSELVYDVNRVQMQAQQNPNAQSSNMTINGVPSGQQAGLNGQQSGLNAQQPVAQTQSEPKRFVSSIESLDAPSCSLSLNAEASGLARTATKEIAARLRAESGDIFIAPTIIDREYSDCIQNLAPSIADGLKDNQSFTISEGNTNISNVISQNIGSSTILPTLIHQSRAAKIPYLVISQVKKAGDKAALTIRIIRTEDGITLSQSYRRLSQ